MGRPGEDWDLWGSGRGETGEQGKRKQEGREQIMLSLLPQVVV